MMKELLKSSLKVWVVRLFAKFSKRFVILTASFWVIERLIFAENPLVSYLSIARLFSWESF